MKRVKLKNMKITLIVILIFKIIETNGGCVWNFGPPGTECLLQCINSNATTVNNEIEDKYNEFGVNQIL